MDFSPLPIVIQRFAPISTATKHAAAAAKLLQSCLTLCDPIDGNPSGSAVHGIFQARVLEWGAIAFFTMLLQIALFFSFYG